jgi:hypothetical protein
MWRIYYSDDSTFSNEDSTPWSVPARDVQVIVQDHPEVGVELVTGGDYYVLMRDEHRAWWWGVDIFGLFDYLIEPGYKRVLFGRTLGRKEYAQIIKKANIDKDGWLPTERRP